MDVGLGCEKGVEDRIKRTSAWSEAWRGEGCKSGTKLGPYQEIRSVPIEHCMHGQPCDNEQPCYGTN